MNILLIEPPFERFQGVKRGFFPLGLASVGAYLQRAGHRVTIYDAELAQDTSVTTYAEAAHSYEKFLQGLNNPAHPIWREVETRLREIKPQVVGISCATVKYEAALYIAGLAKKLSPGVKVILGGPHPTALPEQALGNQQVDYVVRGEGELTMAELLQALSVAGDPPLEKITGLSYRRNGRIIHNPARPLLADLDKLPYPGRELLIDDCRYPAEDMGLLMGSRGCPFACTYCASNKMWRRKVRYRSVENIIGEIRQVQERYQSCQFSFEDDSFTANPAIIKRFCEQIRQQGLKINWSAITRINLLTPELVSQMQRAGCNHLRVGIESGSAKILRDTRKGLTLEQMRRGARILHQQGMYWSAYFMVGLPTETEQDIRATIEFMQEIKPDYATLSIFTPYPGTAIFEQLQKLGKVSANMQWSRFSHASPHNNFALQIEPQRFAELAAWAAQAVDKHNSNLLRLLKRARAKGTVYLQKPGELGKDLRNYLSWKKHL